MEFGEFRKKPVVIEAVRYTNPNAEITQAYPSWFIEALVKDRNEPGSIRQTEWGSEEVLLVQTLEGTHRACIGDWIIRGVQGELYPCKPDIFEATYERITE